MKEKLTGSELELRKQLLGCDCGVVGHIFVSCGEFYAGHFCKKKNQWVLRSIIGIKRKELMEFYCRIRQIGPG